MRNIPAKNRRKGASAVELAMGSFLMLVLTLLAVDIGLLTLAHGVNNQACRDAARAAGMMDNAGDASNAAKFALSTHVTVDGKFFKDLKVTNFVYNGVPPNGTADSLDPANQPTIFCTTELTTRLPVSINFFGAKLEGDNGYYVCKSSFLFPVLNIHVHLPPGQFDPNHNAFFFPQLPTVPTPCYDAPQACPPPFPPPGNPPPITTLPQTGHTPG